ncbi:hypothetical protein ACEPAI_3117 [Sanghuangporus weigelae]
MLKINIKLNGINYWLEPASLKWLANTMVVGFKVIKLDGKAVKGTPGTAAVTASCDMDFVQYHASVSFKLQGLEEEVSAFSYTLMQVTNAGISDGQHARIMTTEIKQLKHRGHQTWFYPMKAEDVDRTSYSLVGCRLTAHVSTQGIAHAAHCTVLHEDEEFSPDALQQVINDISYLWEVSMNSMSLVPPAYWASRACTRARLYLHKVMLAVKRSKEARVSAQNVIGRAKGLWRDGVSGGRG